MQTDIAARFRFWSDKIDETESALAQKWIHVFEDKPGRNANWKLAQTEKYLCVLLRSARLLICAELMRRGRRGYRDTFRADWKEVTEALKYLWNELDATAEFLSDAVDMIALSDPGLRSALLQQLDLRTRFKIRQPKALAERVCTEALDMAAFSLDEGFQEEVLRILDNLVTASRERNAGLPELHRSVVHRSLFYSVDFDHNLSYRICKENLHLFEQETDLHSSWFYWFYGISALRLNNQDEAYSALERCRELFLKNQGIRSWIGTRARVLCLYRLLEKEHAPGAEEELWDILGKIDQEHYIHMDGSAEFVAAFTRMTLLRQHVDQQNMQGLLPQLELLMDYCKATADAPMNSLLTVRHTENMISAYYFETGQFLQAAQHAALALEAVPPEGITPFPSDVLILSNMLKLYTMLNDTGRMIELIDLLVDQWETFEDDLYTVSEVSVSINAAKSKLGMTYENIDDPEDAQDDLEYLMGLHEEIQAGNLQPANTQAEDQAFAQWIMTLVGRALDHAEPDSRQLIRLCEILQFFLDHPETYHFGLPKQMSCLGLMCMCHWMMDSPMAIQYAEEYLKYRNSLTESNENRQIMQRYAAMIYYHYGRREQALDLLEETLAGITTAWHKATAYLNDRKICQILQLTQGNFKVSCSLLRPLCDSETFYERILRFKDLPALVGRERNRLLRLAPIDTVLRDEIFALQNQLAAEEMNDSPPDSSSTAALSQLLQEKEAAFAAQFPQNLQFVPISFPAVCRALPEGSAIVEYFFSVGDQSPQGQINADDLVMDLFITVNRSGTPRLIHRTFSDAERIGEEAFAFIQALQNPEDLDLAGQKDLLRQRLFESLLTPAMEHLKGISTLYIAPDDLLCNLPFEILRDPDGNMLQDRFRILRLVSGRDLLFSDDCSVPAGGGFILGDPDYDTDRGQRTGSDIRPEQEDDFTRSLLSRSKPVSRLPFSGVEAERIARRFRCQAHTGRAATKFALQDALPCGLIHLATHGVFDTESESENSLYSSCLVFAGFNSFLEKKTESLNCGNGILTADEISRMNLSGTHLVVLSACQSGLGSTEYHSTQGLLSAFSAAGVRWVISHMWRANDLATAVLMDAFYEAHLTLGMDVPDALSHAKQYLRTVTAGQLRESGWLEAFAAGATGAAQKQIDVIRNARDRKRFFADEYFWGGFVCHKCK